MAIPDLSPDGLLPEGVHECTLEEVEERFGRFQSSDRRPSLMRRLRQYHAEVAQAGVAQYLVVDGSYVTSVDAPNDIDLTVVLRDDYDPAVQVPPFRYNPRSKKYVRSNFGFDIFFAWENDASHTAMLSFFQEVKHRPGVRKGVLKVAV